MEGSKYWYMFFLKNMIYVFFFFYSNQKWEFETSTLREELYIIKLVYNSSKG